jgi:hypothetical protein
MSHQTTGSDLPPKISGDGNCCTYGAKEGFPAKLPPSASLVGVANIVGMEFELQQVICDTFNSYVLIDPLILVICASIPAVPVPWLRYKLAIKPVSGRASTDG